MYFTDDHGFKLMPPQGKSVAAANLANWAINCVKYHKIYVKVAPLMAKVKEATDTKNTAEASLAIVLAKAMVLRGNPQ